VTKPFSGRELVARIKAVLRRTGGGHDEAAGAGTRGPARPGPPGAAAAAAAAGAAASAGTSAGARSLPGGLELDLSRRSARCHGVELVLTKTELDLLAALAARPGQVLTRAGLLDRVRGSDVVVEERTVDTHVKSLRRKIRAAGGDAELVETVRGVGYRLRA